MGATTTEMSCKLTENFEAGDLMSESWSLVGSFRRYPNNVAKWFKTQWRIYNATNLWTIKESFLLDLRAVIGIANPQWLCSCSQPVKASKHARKRGEEKITQFARTNKYFEISISRLCDSMTLTAMLSLRCGFPDICAEKFPMWSKD